MWSSHYFEYYIARTQVTPSSVKYLTLRSPWLFFACAATVVVWFLKLSVASFVRRSLYVFHYIRLKETLRKLHSHRYMINSYYGIVVAKSLRDNLDRESCHRIFRGSCHSQFVFNVGLFRGRRNRFYTRNFAKCFVTLVFSVFQKLDRIVIDILIKKLLNFVLVLRFCLR